MRRNSVVLGIVMIVSAVSAAAQSFSFYSTLQAGRSSSASWEIGTGTTPVVSNSTWTEQDFFYDTLSSDNHWRPGGLGQEFRIGYNATTNNAYTLVRDASGNWTTALRANPGAALNNAIWTLPASTFNVSAVGKQDPTSIQIASLSFSPGVVLLSGTLPGSLGVSGSPGITTTASLPAPLVIHAASNGGSWFLQGTVQFSGLRGSGGSAEGSELIFNLGASGNQTPEATTMSLLGGGLVVLGWMSRRRRMGEVK